MTPATDIISQALSAASDLSEADVDQNYERAVALGNRDTEAERDEEMAEGSLRLFVLSMYRLMDAVLYAQAVEAHTAVKDLPHAMIADVLEKLRERAAGALRLTHRALEVEGRDTGYEIDEWRTQAGIESLLLLNEARAAGSDAPTLVSLLRDAAVEVGRALIATRDDRMGVAELAAGALAHELAVYVLAESMIDGDGLFTE